MPSAEATWHAAINLQLAMVYRTKVANYERSVGLDLDRIPTFIERARQKGGGIGTAAIKYAYSDAMSIWELNGMSLMHDGLLLLSYWHGLSMTEITRDQVKCILSWAPDYMEEWAKRKKDYRSKRRIAGTRDWVAPRGTNLAHRKEEMQHLADSLMKPENYSALRTYVTEPNLFLAKNVQQSTGIATQYLERLVDNGFTGPTWAPKTLQANYRLD